MVKERNETKDRIKELTIKIKETKNTHKAAQRAFSKHWLRAEFNSYTWHRQPEKFSAIKPSLNLMNVTRTELEILKCDFRTRHIVNSMCHGKSISQIENKVSDYPPKRRERLRVYEKVRNILSEIGKEWID